MNHYVEVLDRIREVARVNVPKGGRVLLYGSRARGDAKDDSDWDLLLILDKNKLEQNSIEYHPETRTLSVNTDKKA